MSPKFLAAYAALLIISSCGAGDSTNNSNNTGSLGAVSIPTVTTPSVVEIAETTAMVQGTVSSDGGASVASRGVVYDTKANPSLSLNHGFTSAGSGTGSFTTFLGNLDPKTIYHVRAYATNSAGTAYSTDVTFSTATVAVSPTVVTKTPGQISAQSAMGGGDVTAAGSSQVIARGVCWSTVSGPSLSNSCSSDGSGLGSFESAMTGLTPNTTYYVRAYATNSEITGYGNEVTFRTKTEAQSCPVSAATSGTLVFLSSGSYNGSLGGATADAWCNILAINAGIIGKSFKAWISDSLGSPSTRFLRSTAPYFRFDGTKIAENWNDLVDGNLAAPINVTEKCETVTSFPTAVWTDTTGAGILLDSSESCSNWTSTTGSGRVGSALAMDSQWQDAGHFGCFSPLRLYCFEQAGIDPLTLPIVGTNRVKDVTQASATVEVSIGDAGSSEVTQYGIVWGLSANPSKTSNLGFAENPATGIGKFNISMTGLTPVTYYWVRGYATNNAGTSYGGNVSFFTSNAVKRVFVSSLVYSGNLGGPNGADFKCQSLASAAGLTPNGQVFKAWISNGPPYDSSGLWPQKTFNHSGVSYHNTRGEKIFDDWNGLTASAFYSHIIYDENGTLWTTLGLLPRFAWTNTSEEGLPTTSLSNSESWLTCKNWTSGLFEDGGYVGEYLDSGNSRTWTRAIPIGGAGSQTKTCDSFGRIYCFEQ